MPKRPRKRITFAVEQWSRALQVKASLYSDNDLLASASRTIPLPAGRAFTADVAELMHLVDDLAGAVRLYAASDPLPFA